MSSDIQFVNSRIKDWKCPVCLELLSNPFLTECCGHHFCSECINSVWRQKNECPLCKACPIKGIVDKRFKRELNGETVYCVQRQYGCEWTGELVNLHNHLSDGQLNGQCRYVMVYCPNRCEWALPRHEMKRHMNRECKYRPFTCPHCGLKGVLDEIVSRHYPECPEYPVTCPNNCSKNKIKRCHLQKHSGICPQATVSCPLGSLGCTVKTIKRCNLKKHNESNFIEHQTLISAAITEIRKENTATSQRVSAQLVSRVACLEKKCSKLQDEVLFDLNEEMEEKITNCMEELGKTQNVLQLLLDRHAEVQETLSATRKENSRLKSSHVTLQSQFHTLENEVRGLKNQLATSNQLTVARDANMKEMLSMVRAETKKMLKDEATDKIASLQQGFSTISQQHLSTKYWIDGYKLMAQKMKKENWKLYLKTMAEIDTQFPDTVTPVILEVNGYERAKRQGGHIITPPFHISSTRGKYKFCLVITFSTPHQLLVAASIMRGEKDNYLTWPFIGTIFVTLLNQVEDKSHHSREIWSATDRPAQHAGKVPQDKLRNAAYSRLPFISYAELEGLSENQCFLMNDSMYFEVNTPARIESETEIISGCCVS